MNRRTLRLDLNGGVHFFPLDDRDAATVLNEAVVKIRPPRGFQGVRAEIIGRHDGPLVRALGHYVRKDYQSAT